ncbi:MAG: zinc-binding dehydrogenase [Chloroflexi bacterium]|nr:zinc-binding dehydrogenase [Chloroflexota bacterium]
MKAAVVRGKQRLEIEDVPTPVPGPSDVLIKIKYNGLCGSDVHRFQYGAAEEGSIMGHEYIGEVVQTGQNVTLWKEGDRVVGGGGRPPEPTGSVFRNARYSAQSVGFKSPKWGGFAEFITLPEWAPSRIPENVPDEMAVLAEPCAIAVHAVRRSDFRVGDDAVVMGAGPIGLLVQQVLKAGGANNIYVSEPAPARAEAAVKLGATRVFDPASEKVVEEIVELTGGLGVPVAFDAAAAKPTLQQGLEMVQRGGQVLVVSMAWVDVPLLTVEWIGREVEMKAAYGSTPEDWATVLTLMERGQIDHKPMIPDDSFIGFDQMQSSMERLMSPDEHIQLVLAP